MIALADFRGRIRLKEVTVLAILSFCAFCFLLGRADDIQSQPLTNGVTFLLGGNRIELRVATPHAFQLHVFSPADTTRTSSIFLSGDTQPETAFTITHESSIIGIKTMFGELRVDFSNGKWSLRDGNGSMLTDWASIRTSSAGSGSASHAVFHLEVGPSSTKARPLYYGFGIHPQAGSLIQNEARAQSGNGWTCLPQYWSNAGYGALLVTAADNKPAAWQANAAGGVSWTVTGGSADLYLAPAVTLYDWLRDDAELTGFAPVPPRWSLGYLQSRWGWKDKAYLDETLKHFRKDHLPVDAFIIDFEWYTKTPDYKVPSSGDTQFIDFEWNPILFPDPIRQLADFTQQGLRIVGIRKPRLGNSENLVLARSKGWMLSGDNTSNGTRDLDYSNPGLQAWWQENNRKFVEAGMAGFWDDEGEATYTDYSYWNVTETALFQQVNPDARFWSLDRAFAPGLQRFGAVAWTGDIPSDWGTLAQTPGELLSYSLSGMPYSTCDIGGFFGDPSPELLTRWMQAGVFFPIQRSHSNQNATPRFPWLYGQEAEDAIQKALDFRYRLIPYYYSLAFENHQTAAPLIRPLVMEFPDDEKVSNMTDEWLVGKGLLVAPVLSPGGVRDVYLPNDKWFSFGTNKTIQGPQTAQVTSKLDEIPVYVRAGTLLPLGPILQYTGQVSTAPLELQIYPGRDGAFNFSEDDGETRKYQKGTARFTAFSWNDRTKTLSWKISGNYNGNKRFHEIKAVLFSPEGPGSKDASLEHDGSITFNSRVGPGSF